MGLDITAYSHMERLSDAECERIRAIDNGVAEGEYDDTIRHINPNPAFVKQADGLPDAYYKPTEQTKAHAFRAGSYSWYNAWRAHLSRFALGVEPRATWNAPERYAGQPFVELIHFSDCEGVIGPQTSAKLARDFAEYAERATAFAATFGDKDDGEWWLTLYAEWRKAFELASDGGLVSFH